MRIIAGICRGKPLKALKGMSTRPTSDRVKEAIFNVLANKVNDAKMLDLFGGTGNVGLEALSRGSDFVTFVEKNPKALQIIKTNVGDCGFDDKVKCYKMDAFRALKLFKEQELKFNLVYIDPPYKLNIIDSLLEDLVNYSLLEPLAVVVAETDKNTTLQENVENLQKIKEKSYGDTKITYYQLV